MDIGAWLRGLGLSQYEQAFRDNAIDAEILPRLRADDLRDVGVTIVGHRRKLLDAVAALRAGGEFPQPPDAEATAPTPSLAATALAAQAERRQLTVMFIDLVGSTALSARLDPEEMGEVLRAYQNLVAGEVTRFEGYVAKYMGDGVLAYFGWPRAHEDEAERGVRAGLSIAEAVPKLSTPAGEPLTVRIGIATGLVVVGDVLGEGSAREEAVVGETPNLAARLQQLATPGAVILGEGTRRLLGRLFDLDDLGTPTVRGFAAPVRAWRALGERPLEGRFEAHRAAGLNPLVGRDRELAVLLERWRGAGAGESQVVVLVGEAGVGKSRLARALRDEIDPEPRLTVRFQCSAFHADSALWPVLQWLSAGAGLAADDDTGARLGKLEAFVRKVGGDPAEAVPLLAATLGVEPGERYPAPGLTPSQQRARTLSLLAEYLIRLADGRSRLLLFEDAHWSDPTSLDLLDEVLERGRRARLMLLVTIRPDCPPRLAGRANVTLLTLSKLDQAAAELLIGHVSGGKHLPSELTAEIAARADGVPLFLEELTKAVLESGQLRPTADAYVPETPLADIAIPASLHESLVARLDRPASGKRVAQTAACIGREFDHELLAAVAEMPETALRAALEELVAAELVFRRGTPPEAAYAFKHALVRDAAYDSLLKTQRQALHGRIVQALRERFPQRVRAQPEVVAHHCSVAGLAASAAELWLEAGLRAKARYANAEAAQRLRNCLRELPRVTAADPQAPTGATREMGLVCLTALGDLAGLAGELDAANGFYRDALGFAADAAAATRLRNKMHRPAVAFRDGAELAYYEHGSGARTLLFANPLTYGLAVFQPLLERLCQEFRVITVDCRGTGRSAPLSRPYLMREHVEDLRVVIEAAGPPVVGVGISRSGNQLLRLARARPDLLEALVTVDMPLGSADPPPPLRYPEVYLERRWALLREGRVEDLVRLQAEYILGQPGERDVAKLWIANCLRLPRETVLSFFDPDPDMDVTGILRSVRTPTLVMHGSADCLNPLAVARHVAAEMPDARLYVFEGRGHLPVLTAPDEFCEVLRRFVLAERRGRERTATRPTLSRESPGQPKGKEPAPRDASALTDQPDE